MIDVTLKFSGLVALQSVSLSLDEGEWIGVVGPNGSGKTSLMNAIAGVYRPHGGEVRYRGHQITHAPQHSSLRAGLVRSFQHPQLSERLTLVENVMLGLERGGYALTRLDRWLWREEAIRSRAANALAEAGVGEFANLWPQETPYGVRRLAEIARAFAAEPVLLLLDEPAAGLSESEREQLSRLLREMKRANPAMSAVVIEHDVAFVRGMTTRLVALAAGRKIAEGTADDVLRSEAVAAAFLGRGVDGARTD